MSDSDEEEDEDEDKIPDILAVNKSKEDKGPERVKIKLKLQEEDGKVHTVKIYKDDPFHSLVQKLKEKWNESQITLRIDGEDIPPGETPEGLHMEDDEIVDVHIRRSSR
uniref:Rad60/SUMO-like domain-containing protein n=2 Tax=Lotharella globosa TaxID=91324 RepID=A0A6V3TYZ5_9EUKA|mmetsp:Transcript_13292/g.26967  ORF Transcript_13292/g.26967 Transcript_13292/m.26967 type:complete len:109 (+) Transcript_13292:480-806(+)